MTPNQRLQRFAKLVTTGSVDPGSGELSLGVDLGTANIVLAVVDEADAPVAGVLRHSTVVRDGIVVDWLGAVRAVSEMKQELESAIGCEFHAGSVCVPPRIDPATVKVFTNVLSSAGMETDEVVDEPLAAARALGLTSGAIVDIGHGTTGVSLLDGGEVVLSVDEATGGHHMSLVISGAMGIDYDEAEAYKRRDGQMAGAIARPTLEKMASIAAEALAGRQFDSLTLVGGASSLPNAPDVFEKALGVPVKRPAWPLFPTPLGTAMRGES